MSRIRIFGLPLRQVGQLLSAGEGCQPLEPIPADTTAEQTVSTDCSLEKLGHFIGRYKLLRVLGEGGMGVVYLVEQDHPICRHVALKIIKPGMDSKQVLNRFRAEQQALALIEHPHVARVYDAGLAPSGRPYFVMEHVKGMPITQHCDKHCLTIQERLKLFLHVCGAVQHAHQKGIIHRDLKPSNILVAVEGEENVPKVIDFGVARATGQVLTEKTFYTEQGQLVGTPEYMSPEQADPGNQDVDTRTDIYSLGAVLYRLLAGVLPFERETLRAKGIEHIRKVICEQDPVTPSTRLGKTSLAESTESAQKRRTDVRTLQRTLRGDLDWITLRAMEKDRTRRYATVEALATDIRNYLLHQPVSAAPPGRVYRTKKFVRRHRQAVAAACTALLVLLTLLWGGRTYVRARRERARFEALEHKQLLRRAQDAYRSGHTDALAMIDTLLTSPHVGRMARLLHAQLLLEDQQVGAAAAELGQLLATPDEVAGQAHFLLANIYYSGDPCAPGETQEFYERFQHHRQQAEQLIADTASYYFLRARVAYSVKQTLQMLEEALKRDRQHYDSLRERAQIYQSQHDYERMLEDAAQMIGVQPDNPEGYALRALALRELGRVDEAVQYHNEAIRLAPDIPQLYDARSETYTCLGEYELALRDAQKCVELGPQDLPYRHSVFAAYTLLGRYGEAQQQYEYFMSYPVLREHHPGNPTQNLRDVFHLYSAKLVTESLAAGRSWHGPATPPRTAPYCMMYYIDPYYRAVQTRGKRLVPKGFHPSWSPDGTRLAYSHGLLKASGVAVLNVETGDVELLTTSGRNPQWSPDGQYIAFERNRRIWPADRLARVNIRVWRPHGWLTTHADEIWLADMVTRKIRRVCEGTSPHWGHRSGRLYYVSARNNALCSVSLANEGGKPVEVLSGCSRSALISPDERYVADRSFRELRIIDVASTDVVATWTAPPAPWTDLAISWSVHSRELTISGGDIGLWIYDIGTDTAVKVMNGWWMTSCWSPDASKLAVTLFPLEIWQIHLDPNVPTAASFDSIQTIEKHCRDFMEGANELVAMDPAYVRAHYVRADCALWMGHEKTDEYLQQFEQVLPPYNAADCDEQARWMVQAVPEVRDRLLPLALLLARKAVEKEPDNPSFLSTRGEALYHAQNWQDAEDVLLKAYNLSRTASAPSQPTPVKVIQLLVQLYESWNKPDEAVKWRSKLPKTHAAEE